MVSLDKLVYICNVNKKVIVNITYLVTTKVHKKMELKENVSKKLMGRLAEISKDCKKSPLTVKNWIYEKPHLLHKWALKSIKKHTGLKEDELFVKNEEL